jgi:hypothetical protein
MIQNALHRHHDHEPQLSGNRSWSRSAGFVLLSCGVFWAVLIGLLWKLL